jgi:hypothetical protein
MATSQPKEPLDQPDQPKTIADLTPEQRQILNQFHGMDKLAIAQKWGISPDNNQPPSRTNPPPPVTLTPDQLAQLEGLHGMDKLAKAEKLGFLQIARSSGD